MQAFVKGIIDSTKATFRRWRRAVPQLFVLDGNYNFGNDVAISGDGQVICVHRLITSTSTYNSAEVTVFKISPDGSAIQLGSKFSHAGRPISFGAACALNFDGTRLAISSTHFDRVNSSGSYTGRIQIYDFVNNQWNLIGTILGGNTTSANNEAIAFNNSGSRIAFYYGFSSPAGGQDQYHTYVVYDFNGTEWTQTGGFLENYSSQSSRTSVSFNADGSIVSTTNKIFELQSGTWVEIGSFPVITTNTGAPYYYAQYNVPYLIDLNQTGDKLVILYKADPQTSIYSDFSWIEVHHRISGSWVFKVKKNIPNYGGVSVNSNGQVFQYTIVNIAYPKFAKDGNRILLSGLYVDSSQIVLPGNSSVVGSQCVICNYNESTNQLIEDPQILRSVRSSNVSAADISKDGKTIVFGKRSDARIGSVNQYQTFGVVDVFRKELD